MIKQRITFELFAPYLQEENSVSEKIERIIIDMMRATILESGIVNTFWSEVVLAMTHIKSLSSTQALGDNINLVEM